MGPGNGAKIQAPDILLVNTVSVFLYNDKQCSLMGLQLCGAAALLAPVNAALSITLYRRRSLETYITIAGKWYACTMSYVQF